MTSIATMTWLRRFGIFQRVNQKPLVKEGQIIQWPKGKGQRDKNYLQIIHIKQRSSNTNPTNN
jgi:hypothetical protein